MSFASLTTARLEFAEDGRFFRREFATIPGYAADMELVILWSAVGLVVFALWAIARHDWVRLTRGSVKVKAKVIGHRAISDDGQKSYSARFAFDVAGQSIEVVDKRLLTQRSPAVGSDVWLNYPKGRPDLARVPRPATWAFVYAMLLGMLTLLIFRLSGGQV